ncbi:MAG TPA: hypothetical protein DDZ78_01370, partial [Porphyromonadaceae bacterium]|nr:hypothetical protein [Porphyromonadaceae bacterium]
ISQIDGLCEWFADRVTIDDTDTIFTFTWDKDDSRRAEIISKNPPTSIRYRWLDENDPDAYFEFLVRKLDLSGDITFEITDFSDPDEKSDSISLWEYQVEELKRKLGI